MPKKIDWAKAFDKKVQQFTSQPPQWGGWDIDVDDVPKPKNYQIRAKDKRTGEDIIVSVDEKMYQQVMRAGPGAQVIVENVHPEVLSVLEKIAKNYGIKQLGFKDDSDLVNLASMLDLDNKEVLSYFKSWSNRDLTRKTLQKIVDEHGTVGQSVVNIAEEQLNSQEAVEPTEKYNTGEKIEFNWWVTQVKEYLGNYGIPKTSFLYDWEEGYRSLYDKNYLPEYAAYSIYNYDN